MVKELRDAFLDRPGFWIFLCVVVVVGGPAFLNQMAQRYLPGGFQLEVAKDIEYIERRSNQFKPVLENQKRMLELLDELQRSVVSINHDIVGLDLRLARLEAWREFQNRAMREESPGWPH